MLDIPSVSGIVAAIGVIVGVVFTVLQLRDLVKTQQTDLVIRLYQHFGNSEFLEAWSKTMSLDFKDFEDYRKKYGPIAGSQSQRALNEVSVLFEGIGVLLHRRLINIGLVDDLFSSIIKLGWEKIKPIAEGIRKELNRPQLYEWFEYLYNEMQKREQTLPATA